jgi:hypothetical protein
MNGYEISGVKLAKPSMTRTGEILRENTGKMIVQVSEL